jgi:hypothetical protein
MILRVGLVMLAALVSVTAQTGSESNSAYRRFQAVQSKPEGVRAAEDWLQIYELQQPDPGNVLRTRYGRPVPIGDRAPSHPREYSRQNHAASYGDCAAPRLAFNGRRPGWHWLFTRPTNNPVPNCDQDIPHTMLLSQRHLFLLQSRHGQGRHAFRCQSRSLGVGSQP